MITFWSTFYNVAIWTICAIISITLGKKQIQKRNLDYEHRGTYFILFLLFFIYSLYSGFGGDNEKYQTFVEGGYEDFFVRDYIAFEELYVRIAMFVNNNFLLWKVVVYGSCLIFTYYTIKRLNVKNNITMMYYVLMCLPTIGTSRAVLAFSIFLFGFSFFNKESKKIYKIIGAIIVISSYYAHSSMIVPILLTPFIFLKFNKRFAYILILLFPIFVYLFNNYYELFLYNESSDAYFSQKFNNYNEHGYGTERSITMTILNYILYFVIIPPVYYGLKGLSEKTISEKVQNFIRLSFLLLYFSFIILFSMLDNETFFNRYFTMIPFFLFPAVSEIFKTKSLSLNKINIYITVVCIYRFAFMYYLLYCTIA